MPPSQTPRVLGPNPRLQLTPRAAHGVPARFRSARCARLFTAVAVAVVALAGIWALHVAAAGNAQAGPRPAIEVSATSRIAKSGAIKSRYSVSVNAKHAGKYKTVRVAVRKSSKPAKRWRQGARSVRLTWKSGAYRGSFAVTSRFRPVAVVSAQVRGKQVTVKKKGPRAGDTLATGRNFSTVRGRPLAVSISVLPARARVVKLQRLAGSRWQTAQVRRISGSKRATVKFQVAASTPGQTRWRVTANKTTLARSEVAAFTVEVAPLPISRVAANTSQISATSRTPGTVSAVINPSRSRTVNLQEYSVRLGRWVTQKTKKAGPQAGASKVTFTLPERPAGTSSWRIQVPEKLGTGTSGASSSVTATTTLEANGPLLGIDSYASARSLAAPFVVAHRGGPARYPESSKEGYAAAAAAGFAVEVDLRVLADGTLVVNHDTTTGRTLYDPAAPGASYALKDIDLATWSRLETGPAYEGGPTGTPLTFDQFLDEFGGRVLFIADIKSSALVKQVVNKLADRGLADTAILQSTSDEGVRNALAQGEQRGVNINARRLLAADFFQAPAATVNARLKSLFAGGYRDLLGCSYKNMAATVLPYLEKNGGGSVIPYGVTESGQVIGLIGRSDFGGFSSDDPWSVWSHVQGS
ncbi:glycerophosphodiester phosphodiesterase [Rarobacter incanus]|uniref:glycerophosphodiester phosphodiesterase n=1 Tax=Rarobacter incanus TaxID=153494 RepID=UPI00147718EE|nr:glycerophosphodiester phosphodiesterase [Rarobacter incanus]